MPLKEKYHIIYDVYQKQKDVVNYIKIFSSDKRKPFPIPKLITYEDYIIKYKDRHFKISQFYGDLTKETYLKYEKEMKGLIKKESNLQQKDSNELYKAFLSFDLKKDTNNLNELLIKEYTTTKFHGDLNKWLWNLNIESYEPVAYYTARLMYSLNKYAKENNKYFIEKKELYRGIQLTYTCLIPYIRAKGKIICLSGFTSTTKNSEVTKIYSGRNDIKEVYETNLKFSVVFYIKNLKRYNNSISNGIDIHQVSSFKKEKEILFLPFTFYFVRDVQIDFKNYIADIYLEAIEKTEILEEKIRKGKNVGYNIRNNIIQIIN